MVEILEGGKNLLDLPVIFDAAVRKTHNAARLSLPFALLCFTSCTHLSHWLDNLHQKLLFRDVTSSHLGTFLANKYWRRTAAL